MSCCDITMTLYGNTIALERALGTLEKGASLDGTRLLEGCTWAHVAGIREDGSVFVVAMSEADGEALVDGLCERLAEAGLDAALSRDRAVEGGAFSEQEVALIVGGEVVDCDSRRVEVASNGAYLSGGSSLPSDLWAARLTGARKGDLVHCAIHDGWCKTNGERSCEDFFSLVEMPAAEFYKMCGR